MTARAAGRAAGAFGALAAAFAALYVLGPFKSEHRIDLGWRSGDVSWAHYLAPAEMFLYAGCAVAGGIATALVLRALGPRPGEALARMLAVRGAPIAIALAAAGGIFALARFHPNPQEIACAQGGCWPGASMIGAAERLLGPLWWALPAVFVFLIVLLCAGLARELGEDGAASQTRGAAAALCAVSPALLATGAVSVAAAASALACVAAVRAGVAFGRRKGRLAALGLGLATGVGLFVQPLHLIAAVLPLTVAALVRARGARLALVRRALPGLLVALTFASLWVAFRPPHHAFIVDPGRLAAAAVRLDQWLFGWPLSLAATLGGLALVGARLRDLPALLGAAGIFAVALVSWEARTTLPGPLVLVPAIPFLAVVAGCLIGRLHARLGGWPLAYVLAATLASAGGFWRLVVLRRN